MKFFNIDLKNHQTQLLTTTYLKTHFGYRQLDETARVIRCFLQGANLQDKLALLLYPPNIELITRVLGCIYGGVVAVPLISPELEYLQQAFARFIATLQNSRTKVVFTISLFLNCLRSLKLPEAKKIIWVATDQFINPFYAETRQVSDIESSTLAYIQYPSESTGSPKGVMVCHSNFPKNPHLLYQKTKHSQQSLFVSGGMPGKNTIHWLSIAALRVRIKSFTQVVRRLSRSKKVGRNATWLFWSLIC